MQLVKGAKVAFIVTLVRHASKLNSQRLVTRWRYQKSTKEVQGEKREQVTTSGTCPHGQCLGERSWVKEEAQLSRGFLQSCLPLPRQES